MDEAAAGDAVGPETFLGREAEGKTDRALPLPLLYRSHTHTLTTHRVEGHRSRRRRGQGLPPGPPAPHLVLGEAELRHPLSHFLGAPRQEGADAPRCPRALGLRLRPFNHSRPRGTRARLHRLHPRATMATRLFGTPLPWQPSLPGGAPLLPSASPSLLSACNAARAPRLCRTKC